MWIDPLLTIKMPLACGTCYYFNHNNEKMVEVSSNLIRTNPGEPLPDLSRSVQLDPDSRIFSATYPSISKWIK